MVGTLDCARCSRGCSAGREIAVFTCSGIYTLSEAWCGVNWADLMAAQGAFGTDFYDRTILRPKHRAYYRSGRPIIKIGPKGALGSYQIRPIHSAPSLGQSIETYTPDPIPP